MLLAEVTFLARQLPQHLSVATNYYELLRTIAESLGIVKYKSNVCPSPLQTLLA